MLVQLDTSVMSAYVTSTDATSRSTAVPSASVIVRIGVCSNEESHVGQVLAGVIVTVLLPFVTATVPVLYSP